MTTIRSKLSLADWILLFAFGLLTVGLTPNAHSDDNQSPTDPFYTFKEWAGPPIRVWFHLPTQFTPDSPIVFVMHGVGRDADRYYAEWRDYAEQYQFALLVPEFSQRDFPKAAGYNLGNVFDTEGHVNPDTLWSFSALDPMMPLPLALALIGMPIVSMVTRPAHNLCIAFCSINPMPKPK
jgi:hypothetical protein